MKWTRKENAIRYVELLLLFFVLLVMPKMAVANPSIELIKESPIYDFIINNKNFNITAYNKTALDQSTEKRIHLYIF